MKHVVTAMLEFEFYQNILHKYAESIACKLKQLNLSHADDSWLFKIEGIM